MWCPDEDTILSEEGRGEVYPRVVVRGMKTQKERKKDMLLRGSQHPKCIGYVMSSSEKR